MFSKKKGVLLFSSLVYEMKYIDSGNHQLGYTFLLLIQYIHQYISLHKVRRRSRDIKKKAQEQNNMELFLAAGVPDYFYLVLIVIDLYKTDHQLSQSNNKIIPEYKENINSKYNCCKLDY